MATDYILFIHGVNTRAAKEPPDYADKLFNFIQNNVGSSLSLKKVVLYWGNVNKDAEDTLREDLTTSEAWNKLWFKEYRKIELLQFAGDAALYISRYVGSQVVEKLKTDAWQELQGYKPEEDRLHIVTHSWGTVILFDILFADRWSNEKISGHQSVMDIRRFLCGLPPNPEEGLCLASIHTMGSPIALFSLVSVEGSSHDFKPLFQQLLSSLYKRLGKPLPWLNFIHPGDPVGWPLEKLVGKLVVDEEHPQDKQYVAIQDVVTQNAHLFDFVTEPVSQTYLALLYGGAAHISYLSSEEVAKRIADTIQEAAKASIRSLNQLS